jgi:Methylene-tetrahydrofolate reductase C terminal
MRNGPCGGANIDGACEVVEKPCIWRAVYERANAGDEIDRLRVYFPPPDRSLQGTSSWINYFLNRDVRPVVSESLTQMFGTKSAALVKLELPVQTTPAEKLDVNPLKTQTDLNRR